MDCEQVNERVVTQNEEEKAAGSEASAATMPNHMHVRSVLRRLRGGGEC